MDQSHHYGSGSQQINDPTSIMDIPLPEESVNNQRTINMPEITSSNMDSTEMHYNVGNVQSMPDLSDNQFSHGEVSNIQSIQSVRYEQVPDTSSAIHIGVPDTSSQSAHIPVSEVQYSSPQMSSEIYTSGEVECPVTMSGSYETDGFILQHAGVTEAATSCSSGNAMYSNAEHTPMSSTVSSRGDNSITESNIGTSAIEIISDQNQSYLPTSGNQNEYTNQVFMQAEVHHEQLQSSSHQEYLPISDNQVLGHSNEGYQQSSEVDNQSNTLQDHQEVEVCTTTSSNYTLESVSSSEQSAENTDSSGHAVPQYSSNADSTTNISSDVLIEDIKDASVDHLNTSEAAQDSNLNTSQQDITVEQVTDDHIVLETELSIDQNVNQDLPMQQGDVTQPSNSTPQQAHQEGILQQGDFIQQDIQQTDAIQQDPIQQDPIQQDPIQQDPIHQDTIQQDVQQEDVIQLKEVIHQDSIHEENVIKQDDVQQNDVQQQGVQQESVISQEICVQDNLNNQDNLSVQDNTEISIEQNPNTIQEHQLETTNSITMDTPVEMVDSFSEIQSKESEPSGQILEQTSVTEHVLEPQNNVQVYDENTHFVIIPPDEEVKPSSKLKKGNQKKKTSEIVVKEIPIEQLEFALDTESTSKETDSQDDSQDHTQQVFILESEDNVIVMEEDNIEEQLQNLNEDDKDITDVIPHHLIGRNMQTPAKDHFKNGRIPPKPRLGVKVPYRNLTSQIVSKQEIEHEIMKRHGQKMDSIDSTNVIFARKLSKRLADKIVPDVEPEPESEPEPPASTSKESTGTIENNSDLLAILEGEDEETPPAVVDEEVVKNMEKEIALKQLSELPQVRKYSKKKHSDYITKKLAKLKKIGLEIPEIPAKIPVQVNPVQQYVPADIQVIKKNDSMTNKMKDVSIIKVQKPAVSSRGSAATPVKPNGTAKVVEQTKSGNQDSLKRDNLNKQNLNKDSLNKQSLNKGGSPSKVTPPKTAQSNATNVQVSSQRKILPQSEQPSVKSQQKDDPAPKFTPRMAVKTYTRKRKITDEDLDLEEASPSKIPSIVDAIKMEFSDGEDEDSTPKVSKDNVSKANKSEPKQTKNDDLKQSKNESKDKNASKQDKNASKQDKNASKQDKNTSKQDKNTSKQDKNASKQDENDANQDKQAKTGTKQGKNVAMQNKIETTQEQTDPKQGKNDPKEDQDKKQAGTAKKALENAPKTDSPASVYMTKSSRIIKKKIIWDPAESTSKPALKPQKPIEVKPASSPAVKKATKVETNSADSTTVAEVEKKPPVKGVRKSTETKVLSKDDESSKDSEESSSEEDATPSVKKTLPNAKNKPKRTELDKLLGDEGAINMLYSIKNTDENQNNEKQKKRAVVSLDKAARELMNRANEIKNELETSTSTVSMKSLRKKDSVSPVKSLEKTPVPGAVSRKKSRDSTMSSIHSPPASPPMVFPGASRIIRRHSSSSFSSEDDSQDENSDTTAQEKSAEKGPGRALRRKAAHPPGETPKSKKAKKSLEKEHLEVSTKDVQLKEKEVKAGKSPKKAAKVVETPAKVVETPAKVVEVPAKIESPKEILDSHKSFTVKIMDHLTQVILTPPPNLEVVLTVEMLKDLSTTIKKFNGDKNCRVILFSSSGNSFCHGIDYKGLVAEKEQARKTLAKDLANAVREFLRTLAHSPKILVAGVHGDVVGLGVMMLPLFDMVIASDTATFSTPYGRLGCAPEAGCVLGLPNLMKNVLVSELLISPRKLIAIEAQRVGLVTRIIWPDKFQEELISSSKVVSLQSAQFLEVTKKLSCQHLHTAIDEGLKAETEVLIKHWTSPDCQTNFSKYN